MTFSLRPPSVVATRKAIDEMSIHNNQDEIFQNALRYLYLIAGRISEVYGIYSPKGVDAYSIDINGTESVLFPVKTAFRNGNRRSVALPVKLDPWLEKIYELFVKDDEKNPFDIGENNDTSKRYLQEKALDVFKGHEWKTESYTHVDSITINEDKIIKTRTKEKKIEYLIEYDDGERHWHKGPNIKKSIKIPEHWDKFTCQDLRSQRIRDLKQNFDFTDEQFRTYTGLKQRGKSTSIIEWPGNEPISDNVLERLEELSKSYFINFL